MYTIYNIHHIYTTYTIYTIYPIYTIHTIHTIYTIGEKYMNIILQELSITPVNGYLTPLFKSGNRKYVNGKDGNDN